MHKLDEFIGDFISGLTAGRARADAMSHQIAEEYLKHNLLKGFPVPKMTISSVELDFCFRFAESDNFSRLSTQPETQKAIAYRLSLQLIDLFSTESGLIEQLFDTPFADDRWPFLVRELQKRVQDMFSQGPETRQQLNHMLLVLTENYLFELHQRHPDVDLVQITEAVLADMMSIEAASSKMPGIRSWLTRMIDDVVEQAIPQDAPERAVGEHLEIFVGGQELENCDPDKVQRVKLNFTAQDRKWVTIHENGETKHILDR